MGDVGNNALISFVLGLAAFGLVFVPLLVAQSRRYGRISVARVGGAAALSVYAVALGAYTLLPLPAETPQACARFAQLVPFHVVADVRRETAGMSPLATLTSHAVLQYVLNIALFVPWGLAMRRLFSRSVLFTVLSGIALSLLIEATQYTADWGLYPCAYRLADVDDLISNTAGAAVGAFLAPVLLWWMPRRGELRSRRLEPRPVTARRRWLGMLFDWIAFGVVGFVLSIAFVEVPHLLGAEVPPAAAAGAAIGVPAALVFLVPALRRPGATPGQYAVWLEPSWSSPTPSLARRLVRMIVPLAWVGLLIIEATASGPTSQLAGLTALIVAVTEVVAVGVTGGRGLGSLASGAVFTDTRRHAGASHVPSGVPWPN